MAEIAASRFKLSSSGKLNVESKDERKTRRLLSPDIAAATVIYGVSDGGSWNKPLKRSPPVVALFPVGDVSADGELQRRSRARGSYSLIFMRVQPQNISATTAVSRSAVFCNR